MPRYAGYSASVSHAAANYNGVTEWTLDHTIDMLDATGFDSAGNRQFAAGLSQYKGTITSWKTGIPLAIGSEITLKLMETATATQNWNGNALLGQRSVSTPTDGLIKYTYQWQGTGAWTAPTA